MKLLTILFFTVLFFFSAVPLNAAEVTNVQVSQEGSRIRFDYDITAEAGEAETQVDVTIIVDGRAYKSADLHLEGAFGKVKPGKGKTIYWNPLQEFPQGLSRDFNWEITTIDSKAFTDAISVPFQGRAPMATVEANVKKVLDVLRDPKLKGPSAKEIKKEKLRVIYKGMFDEVEFSRRTLARNWTKLNPAQQKEFVVLFEQVLEKAYIDKILDYSDEKVDFYKENMISDNQAEIQTKVVTSSKEIPIFYRVTLKDGKWKVYDVVVENVSLVQNYRTQFNDILGNKTPEQLLEILRKKVKEH